MLYVTMKWLAPTWKIISSAKQISVLLQMFKTFLPLRWLFLLIILKANSGRKVMFTKWFPFSPGNREKLLFPTPLHPEKDLWLLLTREISTENTGLKSWPRKSSGVFVQTPVHSFSFPLLSVDLKQRNNGRLQCPRVWQCHHVSNILSECSLLLFSSWDAVVITAVSTYTHTEWEKKMEWQ